MLYYMGPHELADLPKGFAAQRGCVLQLLKDAYHPYSLSSPARANGIPRNTSQEGYANINPTVTDRWDAHDRYMASHRALRTRLERMQTTHPLYYALERVFLHDEANDRAYEDLEDQAAPALKAIHIRIQRIRKKGGDRHDQITAWRGGLTPALRLFTDVQLAIHDLTISMMNLDLWVHDPDKAIAELEKAKPKIPIEERYAEINRIFDSYCRQYERDRPGKRYRNRAYEATAVHTAESKTTVERAVRHCTAKLTQGELPA